MKIFVRISFALAALALLIGGINWNRNWKQFMKEKTELSREIHSFYSGHGCDASRLALKITRPYLSDEQYGRHDQRIDMLRKYYSGMPLLFSSPNDSYDSIIYEVSNEYERWAHRQHPDARRQDLFELFDGTPREEVMELHQQVQDIALMKNSCYADDFDREALDKLRKQFDDRKQRFEAAMAAAERELDEQKKIQG